MDFVSAVVAGAGVVGVVVVVVVVVVGVVTVCVFVAFVVFVDFLDFVDLLDVFVWAPEVTFLAGGACGALPDGFLLPLRFL